jgi:hypothetical protein
VSILLLIFAAVDMPQESCEDERDEEAGRWGD